MAADYDDKGNYRYPEGFDVSTNEWKPGYEEARGKWEADYAEAHQRWELHKTQVKAMREKLADLPDAVPSEAATPAEGSLAQDESLSSLRDQLAEDK
jgi:small subunit ribosomal protein S1